MADLKAELMKSEVPVGVSSGSLQTSTDGALPPKPSDVSKTLLKQIEYYFSNNNLWRDQFLLNEIAKDPEGWVPISLVADFSRIKALSSDLLQICSALRQSKKLELSRDLFKVRRIHVVPPYNPKKDAKRTIYVDKLPPGSTLKSVRKLFSKFGRVTYVTKVNPLGEAVSPNADVREAPPQEVSNTAEITTALVEFAKKEAAKKAITMIQAHNIKRGIIFPATPTFGGGGTSTIISSTPPLVSMISPGTPPTLQPVVAYEPPFEIKALDFKLQKKEGGSAGGSPTTGGSGPTSFVTVTPATPTASHPNSTVTSPVEHPVVKETQSAPSSVSSSPATSPPPPTTQTHTGSSSPPTTVGLSPHTGSSPPKSSLSPHASPFIPSTPSTASTSVNSSPSVTPGRPGGSEFTPSASPLSSPGTSPASTPGGTGSPAGSSSGGGSNSPNTPPTNGSPPKEIDINLYTGFHILTKMSYLKKLGQLSPHHSEILSSETKKTLGAGGKQSPFRFAGQAKPSPRSPFNQWRDDEDGGRGGSDRPRGHNRSHSNPYPQTYPPAISPISPPSKQHGVGVGGVGGSNSLGGRATPERVGGRSTPDRTGRAITPDRVGRTPDRTSTGGGGRITPDRLAYGMGGGRLTPTHDSRSGGRMTPDRLTSQQHQQQERGATPDRNRNLVPRPGSGSGHRDRSGSSGFSPSPRAQRGILGQSPARDVREEMDVAGRHRAGSADQAPLDYYKLKYDEEKQRNDALTRKLQQLIASAEGAISPGGSGGGSSGGGGGGGSPRSSPKSSPHKNRRRAKSSDIGGDKSERGYNPVPEEQSGARPKLKLLSSRLSSSGVSIAQRFAQGPDETGGFLGGRGAGRGRGAPLSSASPSS